ncbi:MAG: hypothetical protein IT168_19710 [Bryobacterales bacterium]|nr:hypothetical protein [Bryobacterales bacterium]
MITLRAAAAVALEKGLEYLCAAQDESGCWTDFCLPVGASDAWVTAFAGLALVERYPENAHRAAAWLTANVQPSGGWGYNGSVAADADSTAFAMLFLSGAGRPIPPAAVRLLWSHYRPSQGFATYSFDDPEHQWTYPCHDVTASALLALHASRELSQADLRRHFDDFLKSYQEPDGSWQGYWWDKSSYPTALVFEVWAAAGKPPLMYRPSLSPANTSFDTASSAMIAAHWGDHSSVEQLVDHLLRSQQPDGAWPGDARLRVEPSHPNRNPYQRTIIASDRRRIFTTAQATRALARALPLLSTERLVIRRSTGAMQTARPSLPINYLHSNALPLFECLTRSTFDGRTEWPAPQLSSLSGGVPVEFSAGTSASNSAELRYTVDAGEVQAPPHRRAASALRTANEAIGLLGYQQAWERLQPAFDLLLETYHTAAPATRFLIWIGVDHAGFEPPSLKLYFRLLPGADLWEVAQSAGLPISSNSLHVFDLLHKAGFAQELGFGLGPQGRVGLKIYWELPGWRRNLVDQILAIAQFPATAGALCPEIPLVLRESLAAKSRAGISVRLDTVTGDIVEVTSTAAFIQHMLPGRVIADRVDRWIAANGWNPRHHRRLFDALSGHGDPTHTLFTRTVSRAGDMRATIYLRPPAAIFTSGLKPDDTNAHYLAQDTINQTKERTYS